MKVPLVRTEPPPEFGELHESADFLDPNIMDHDHTYVPGFSELRIARDKAIIEVMNGTRSAKDVPILPVNYRWTRFQDKQGEPDNRKVIRAGNRGYKIVTKDDVGEGRLLPSMPPGAVPHETDGSIRLGDTILMVADGQRVARNEAAKRAKTARATQAAIAGFAASLESVGGAPIKGASPFIQKEVGRPVLAELNPKQKKSKEV